MLLRWTLCGLVATVMIAATTLAYLHLIPGGWFHAPWDKAGHFFLYGGLALTLALALPPHRRALAWMIPLALGVLDEATQSLSPIRSADLLDLAADSAGILLAVTLAGLPKRRSIDEVIQPGFLTRR